MTDYAKEKRLEKKREYYRRWRAEHPESVRASQAKYWARKAAEMANQMQTETRAADPANQATAY